MRSSGLTVEDLGDEVLVYDHEADTAHCLCAEAAAVWRACDGRRKLDGVMAAASVDRETAEHALAELTDKGLLAAPALQVEHAGNGISRRQAVGRIAAAAAVPMVVSVAAPTAWATHSVRARTTCPADKTCDPVGTTVYKGCKDCGAANQGAGTCPEQASTACEFDKNAEGERHLNGCCPTGFRCTCNPCTGATASFTCTHI